MYRSMYMSYDEKTRTYTASGSWWARSGKTRRAARAAWREARRQGEP